jgi:DNA polymerase, archaea type
MLEEFLREVRERDPDVIEGHNILGFDLPYIAQRCSMHGVPFRIGRDGAEASHPDSAAETYRRGGMEIPGRHVVDTLHLVRAYDTAKRAMESHGLKYAARYFNLAPADRTYVEGEKISWLWDNDPATLVRYALDDVRETRALATHLAGNTFYLSRMVPQSYGTLSRSGAAAKIEMLLLRAYVRARRALPRPSTGIQTTGGYTDIFFTGVLDPVVHADVESLYPSIMLADHIAPATDSLGVFLPLLESLTRLRLEAKRLMQQAVDPDVRSRTDALQSSYKILINSFYGYLGYSLAIFNDYTAADRVTKNGQRILHGMME